MMPSFLSGSRRLAATAGLLALGGAMACVDDPAPPTSLTATGQVAGVVFFDRDNNNLYTPTAGDSAMPNVTVQVRARGTTTVVTSMTTDAQGRYAATVPVGTHDIFVVEDASILAAELIWCGARPSVYANELAFVNTPMKFGCVIRIENAKLSPLGSTVTVSGVITARPGRFRNDNLYLQDFSGGLQVFGVPAGSGLVEGDSIEVTGELGAFNDQFQIVAPRIAANVKSGTAIPDPRLLTTQQAAQATTATNSNIGRLVRVQRAQFTGPFSGGNAVINDGSGPTQLRLDNNSNTTIGAAAFVTGRCYDITGILGFFRGTAQLLPRSLADVTEVSCS